MTSLNNEHTAELTASKEKNVKVHIIYVHIIYGHIIYVHILYGHTIYTYIIYAYIIYTYILYLHILYMVQCNKYMVCIIAVYMSCLGPNGYAG